MSSIEDIVCEKILKRAEVGKAKYGVTMERGDLSIIEWLNHLQEELMDASVYIERILGDLSAAIEEANMKPPPTELEIFLDEICKKCGALLCDC